MHRGTTMRGKIIHYNSNDGRGLVSAAGRQIPFEIRHWRSETAPSVNATVELEMAGETLEGVSRIPDDVLLKEKAGQFANRLGAAGGAALQSLGKQVPETRLPTQGWLRLLGKPLLIAQAVFTLSALALPYISVGANLGVGRSVTLAGLSHLSEQMGASVGGAFWVWLAILSIALPVLWKSRWAWLALLLPLLATLKPVLDVAAAARKAARGMEGLFGANAGDQVMNQMLDMIEPGIGFGACLLAAVFTAGLGLKRVLLPPAP